MLKKIEDDEIDAQELKETADEINSIIKGW